MADMDCNNSEEESRLTTRSITLQLQVEAEAAEKAARKRQKELDMIRRMKHQVDQRVRTRDAKLQRFNHAIDVLFTLRLDTFLQFADLKLLLNIRLLNKVMKESIDLYVIRRISDFLARWVESPRQLRKLLQVTKSVISGSGAVYLVVKPDDWVPHDLDIFAPLGQQNCIVNYLVDTEHYERVPLAEADPNPTIGGLPPDLPHLYLEDPPRTFRSVVKLRKPHPDDDAQDPYQYIDVIESTIYDATYPILNFPSTVAMNWIESDRIFCAYPELTLNGCGMLNGFSEGPAAERTQTWRDKYEARGFVLISNMDTLGSPCGVGCVALERSVGDVHCSIFRGAAENPANTIESRLLDNHPIRWSLRGWYAEDELEANIIACTNEACPNHGRWRAAIPASTPVL